MDISDLTPEQRTARAHHIEVLHGYAQAGVFAEQFLVAPDVVPMMVGGCWESWVCLNSSAGCVI